MSSERTSEREGTGEKTIREILIKADENTPLQELGERARVESGFSRHNDENLDWETKKARQKLDDGDPEEPVFAKLPLGGTDIYHKTEGCVHLKQADEWEEMTRRVAKRRWLAGCLVCVFDGGKQ